MNGIIAIAPGETIKELLADRNINIKNFCKKMDFSKKDVDDLLSGDMEITEEIAEKLGNFFGIEKSFWINLENIYRKDKFLSKMSSTYKLSIKKYGKAQLVYIKPYRSKNQEKLCAVITQENKVYIIDSFISADIKLLSAYRKNFSGEISENAAINVLAGFTEFDVD